MIRTVWLVLLAVMAGCQWPGEGATRVVSDGESDRPRTAGVLVRADHDVLLAHLRGALESNGAPTEPDQSLVFDAASPASEGRGVSTTNLQEAGVDEADFLKVQADGRVIYAMTPPAAGFTPTVPLVSDDNAASSPASSSVRIMGVGEDGTLTELSRVDQNDAGLSPRGLYLAEALDRLVTIEDSGGPVYAYWFQPFHFLRRQTRLRLIDIAAPARARVVRELSFDGALVASRRVGHVLYLVLRHYPPVAAGAGSASLSLDGLLPHFRVDGRDLGTLVSANDCYLDRRGVEPSADVIALVAVDLRDDGDSMNAVCYVGATEALYASSRALYLASTRYPYRVTADGSVYESAMRTDVHKFAFDGLRLEYRGSGEVPGHLGWHQDQKSFRFSESAQGDLRVITFNEERRFVVRPIADGVQTRPETVEAPSPQSSPVSLTILRESPTREALEVVGRLPNPSRPEPLGRAGEQLYASRFIGDRAYLVTFRVTDPLYILDLSDPADPYIAAALKISGYSDYLHPVSDSLLLGVGKEAVPAANDTGGDSGGAWYQGVKLSLIDISNPAAPFEADRLELGKRGTQSEALRVHHAVTTRRVGDTMRLALPVELHDRPGAHGNPEAVDHYHEYTHTGLYRFAIDIPGRRIEMLGPAMIVARPNDGVASTRGDRSAMVGDWLYYWHAGAFWRQSWSDGVLTGPH